MSGTLYLAATPIGNLGDVSQRFIETLEAVDFIAAEDTRVTRKLLTHFDIKKPLVSYYEHNRRESGAKIVERLLAGESCALVSDAGTPAISDPGEDLVALCAASGVPVVPIPGCCAAISALAVSGLPTGRFCFEGFLSTARKSRFEHLTALKDEKRTMIFYEAPHKLLATLQDMLSVWGDRQVSISRELTKLHEETLRLPLSQAVAHFQAVPPRGEFVLVVQGAAEEAAPTATLEEALALVDQYRAAGASLKDAARQAAEATGFAKNELYRQALSAPDRD